MFMKTAIIYSSKYGTTEKVARIIARKIEAENDVTLIPLADTPAPDISGYEKIILGTSIYAGKSRANMRKFCKKYGSVLNEKIIGLFVCGMQSAKKAEELRDAYPEKLHNIAKAEDYMGGEFLLEKMNFLVSQFVRRLEKTEISVSKLDYDAIDVFSNKMK